MNNKNVSLNQSTATHWFPKAEASQWWYNQWTISQISVISLNLAIEHATIEMPSEGWVVVDCNNIKKVIW